MSERLKKGVDLEEVVFLGLNRIGEKGGRFPPPLGEDVRFGRRLVLLRYFRRQGKRRSAVGVGNQQAQRGADASPEKLVSEKREEIGGGGGSASQPRGENRGSLILGGGIADRPDLGLLATDVWERTGNWSVLFGEGGTSSGQHSP